MTVTVENLTSEAYEEEDLSGIPELVEVITLQATGPTEAARAIRKKLKYGNVHRQIRALVLLDGLIQNAGERFQRTFVDEPLLERLRVCGTSDLSDVAVRNKCRELFRSWSQYAGRPGLDSLSRLHRVSNDCCKLRWSYAHYTRNFPKGSKPSLKSDRKFSKRRKITRSSMTNKRLRQRLPVTHGTPRARQAQPRRPVQHLAMRLLNLRPGPVHSLGALRIRRRIKTRIKPRGSESLSTSRLKRIR